jgi:glycosyltransferase involved in cell wall biosynthesis
MNSVTRVPETAPAPPPAAAPSVDVVVPAHNEQGVLPASIRRLHDYLSASLPLNWRIVIADNASTDETLRIAMALAEDLPNVSLLALRPTSLPAGSTLQCPSPTLEWAESSLSWRQRHRPAAARAGGSAGSARCSSSSDGSRRSRAAG